MFMFDTTDKGWWYGLASTLCLWPTVTIYPDAYVWTLIVAIIQLVHYSLNEGNVKNFPVQIRLGYLSYVLIAMPENLHWLLWLPTLGTLVRTLFGYCLMARMLALLPINRQVPLSWQYVLEAFLTPPARESILHRLPVLKADLRDSTVVNLSHNASSK